MTDLVNELARRAHALAPEARARLAEELLASVSQVNGVVEEAWDQEIRKRIEDVEAGAVQLIDADEVFARLRQALR